MSGKQALCVLGNQLFPDKYLEEFKGAPVFMAEDQELCTYYKFHKHKIILFLSAMRHLRDRLRDNGFKVNYVSLEDRGELPYMAKLKAFIDQNHIEVLHFFEVEDKFMESRIVEHCREWGVSLTWHETPMFTCSRAEFAAYLEGKKKPFMKTFYEAQRRRLDVLMEDGKPYGGKFSYDTDNRRKLPKGYAIPDGLSYKVDDIDREVMRLVEHRFVDHPGRSENFWIPTTRKAALKQLKHFVDKRLEGFGPYQDAICADQSFLHHSLVSPAVNCGLITPDELVDAVLQASSKRDLPIESVEGFIRQVIGWREFVRGVYQHYSDKMDETNYWNHRRRLKSCWYSGDTGLPPLDDAIERAVEHGYSHHIERLMILANLMNLCEIEPRQVYGWFMEMYVDSSDWVMAANVYGMGLMSDGGIFATKPYISGSNYIMKMSDYKKGPWCDIWDGLYWRFVENHFDFFDRNPRMRMMTRTLLKMDEKRKTDIFTAADEFIHNVTES